MRVYIFVESNLVLTQKIMVVRLLGFVQLYITKVRLSGLRIIYIIL